MKSKRFSLVRIFHNLRLPRSLVIGLSLILLSNLAIAQACPKARYSIGVQAIDYSPHYNFVAQNSANFFGDYVEWLNQYLPCKFEVTVLPIKRLNLLFEQGSIDFIYPDNPNWHDEITSNARSYSNKLVTALGGTVVKKSDTNISLPEFNRLAFPRGFTPIAWLPLQSKYIIEFIETTTAKAALLMVLANRAQGADVEWNVANYLIKQHNLTPMALGHNLPFTPTDFHLATSNHVEILGIINKLMKEKASELQAIKKNLNLQETLSNQEVSNNLYAKPLLEQ